MSVDALPKPHTSAAFNPHRVRVLQLRSVGLDALATRSPPCDQSYWKEKVSYDPHALFLTQRNPRCARTKKQYALKIPEVKSLLKSSSWVVWKQAEHFPSSDLYLIVQVLTFWVAMETLVSMSPSNPSSSSSHCACRCTSASS